jgi:ATP-binding cassette, subfamily B, bacterial HlyB/CyaB
MNRQIDEDIRSVPLDVGLRALCGIASYYRIAADPGQLAHELALGTKPAGPAEIIRAAALIGLKARLLSSIDAHRLESVPAPAILRLRAGGYAVFGGRRPNNLYRVVDPVTSTDRMLDLNALFEEIEPEVILLARKIGGPGVTPGAFGFHWFLPSIWRYRKPLGHVLIASFFLQIFALVTPLFFQVIVDKVLAHKSYSTLLVLIVGLIVIGFFDVLLSYLRSYALSHTSNRIDVELGWRLFHQLLRLPLGYFESRAAGQTVARIRELESIRQFLTGQGLFSALDLIFAAVFIAVLFAYSWSLTLIVVLSIPLYLAIAFMVRPTLRARTNEKFNRGAESQQLLVEAVVGIHTVKAAAVEPIMQAQWEEKLAAYVRSAFSATMVAVVGQNAIQYVNRVTMALVLLFGAKAVMDGDLSMGELIAFNMIAGQTIQPILRLSQVWQDFLQVQVSVERLGDILNATPEFRPLGRSTLPAPRGQIEFRNVTFRYRPGAPDVLRNMSFGIRSGEVVGIIGPSGSGKSTLSKMIQRLYLPNEGQILLDGADLSQADPGWLRRHIGVVLQENILFNRTIHDNIAFSNPAMHRAQVVAVAKLAGADEFIAKLPEGYDSMVEERGANLSGGQRQRIAIARALALDPPILIFDEATSALDYESERIIQTNMKHIVRNRTVIIIAHRLAAVRPCNRIFGVVDGRVVEGGTHDELMARPNGLYAYLWALQNSQATP